MDKIGKLLELINDIVNAEGMTWKEKRDAVVSLADDSNMLTSLDEFASWFEKE